MVHAFYAFESSFLNNHHNHENDVIIIPFAMGTCQGDPLKGALFVLAHFKALRSKAGCLYFYLFLFIADDTHIISPLLIISSTYEHF